MIVNAHTCATWADAMPEPTTAVVAFEVRQPVRAPNGIDTYKALSRRYTVRDAAEQFCAMAKSAGHPRAYVAEVWGAYSADPTKGKRGRK